jgi:hypothetical protein
MDQNHYGRVDFRRYSGINRVTIVRPPIERVANDGTVVWGSYSIWP